MGDEHEEYSPGVDPIEQPSQVMLIAADENFHHDIIRGLRRKNEALDIVRVQDLQKEADDPVVLEWAKRTGCS